MDIKPKSNKPKQAIALSYDPSDDAPKVVASGRGILAEKIIENSGYKYGFMTNSFPVLPKSSPFMIQRINVEDNWSLHMLKFQICGLMDIKMFFKRKRIEKLLTKGK